MNLKMPSKYIRVVCFSLVSPIPKRYDISHLPSHVNVWESNDSMLPIASYEIDLPLYETSLSFYVKS